MRLCVEPVHIRRIVRATREGAGEAPAFASFIIEVEGQQQPKGKSFFDLHLSVPGRVLVLLDPAYFDTTTLFCTIRGT